jgi:hypothetical protein
MKKKHRIKLTLRCSQNSVDAKSFMPVFDRVSCGRHNAELKRLFAIITLILLLVIIPSCSKWSDADLARTKEHGDIVRNALQQYRDRMDSYPKDLQSLIPDYLDKIPEPTVGKKMWTYKTYQQRSDYLLSVLTRSESEPELHADPIGWTYDTK